MDSNTFTFASLIALVRQYARSFILVGIAAIAVGVVISLPVFMAPIYQSTAVVYPVNIKPYSDESETEQLLQYFESSAVRDSIIERFDLYTRYDIERDEKGSRFAVIREFNDHFTISKTLYESVRIEVLDEDPEVAKAIVDSALTLVNQVINASINSQGQLLADSYAEQMAYQRTAIDSIEAAVSRLSTASGALEYGSQTRELMRGYIDMMGKSENSPGKKNLDDMLGKMQESGSTVRMLQNLSYFATLDFEGLSKEYLAYRELSMRKVNYIDVVVSPEVADKKAWPVRWLVVAICLISALGFLTVYIAITRSIQNT